MADARPPSDPDDRDDDADVVRDDADGRDDAGAGRDDPDDRDDDADAVRDDADGPEAKPPVEVRRGGRAGGRGNPLPWYRRGTVWLWFVLASALGAWLLSGWAEDRLYTVDVEPGAPEAEALCTALPSAAGLGLFSPSGVPAEEPDLLADWVAASTTAHEAVVEAAPEQVADDAAELRDAFAAVVVAADGADAEGAGAAWDDAVDEHEVAIERLDTYATKACGAGLVVWPAWP